VTTPELAGVAKVRPGADLDWPKVAAYLRARLPGLDGELEVLQCCPGSGAPSRQRRSLAAVRGTTALGDRGYYPDGQDRLGLPAREEVLAVYAGATGLDLSAIGWYQAFACWKTAVVLRK
jgi:hypothetical protein